MDGSYQVLGPREISHKNAELGLVKQILFYIPHTCPNWAKSKFIGGHSPDPTPKEAILAPKKPKNDLICYCRYLKKWVYKKISLAKVAQKNFFCE